MGILGNYYGISCGGLNIFLPKIKGFLGEKSVEFMLSTLPKEDYIVLNNLMVRTDRGTTQIDHVVLSLYGIFVIEVKNYKGWIIGNEKSHQWTQNIYGKKYTFKNPIHQNYGHVKALENALHLSIDSFIPIVSFSVNADLKTKTDSIVLYSINLKKKILEFHKQKFTNEEMVELEKILTDKNIDSRENRKNHVKAIRTNLEVEKAQIKQNICPKCHGNLVERTGKYGNFTGCSNFPKCKYTVK